MGSSADPVQCPNCGAINNRSFKFCGTCGYPLADAGPAPAPTAAAPPTTGHEKGILVLIRPDGTEGESLPFDPHTILGRDTMPVFSGDSYLSPRHASFHFGSNGVVVRDEDSLNGVYVRIDTNTQVELVHGTIFRIGQEIIRFEAFPPISAGPDGVEPMGSPREGLVGRICLIIGRNTYGNCYAVPQQGLHLGRERGDILFPDDGYVSGLHARIHPEGGKIFLTDVGSSNGTFLRIQGQAPVTSGSMLLMGQQLFRIEY
ncbi:MAG: FHA domain-containing protein [Sandaracinaceae bacterium]